MDNIRITLPTPFELGSVNCYLIDADEVTLVDAGVASEEATNVFYRRLEAAGYSVSEIDRLLLTHPHVDHFGLAAQIKDESGAQVYAHADATGTLSAFEDRMEREREYLLPILRSMGVPDEVADSMVSAPAAADDDLWEPVETDIAVTEGDTIDIGLELTVVETPGHCTPSISFVDETSNRAWVGDHILEEFIPLPLLMLDPSTDESRTRSLPDYLEGLAEMKRFDLDIAYSGHGDPVTDVDARINEVIDQCQTSAEEAAEIVRSKGPLTAYQVQQNRYPNRPPEQTPGLLSTTIGHLDILEKEGRVEVTERDGQLYYEMA